jgi:hypothetical protein
MAPGSYGESDDSESDDESDYQERERRVQKILNRRRDENVRQIKRKYITKLAQMLGGTICNNSNPTKFCRLRQKCVVNGCNEYGLHIKTLKHCCAYTTCAFHHQDFDRIGMDVELLSSPDLPIQ